MARKAAPENTVKDVLNVLVYSDNRITREDVINAVGKRVGANLPDLVYTEAATWEGAEIKVQEGDFDLMILDAESHKLGGIGLGMKIRDEIDPNIPYIVLIARPQDDWLARVAKPSAIISYPINPRELSAAVAKVLTTQK